MDQQSLKYLSSQRLLEGIQHKLMLKLLLFDFSIEYKQGKENTVADALSRKHCPPEDHCNAHTVVVPSWMNEVESTYHNDEKYTQLL
jgi:hypothetical protein